jgi:hypothetical protein
VQSGLSPLAYASFVVRRSLRFHRQYLGSVAVSATRARSFSAKRTLLQIGRSCSGADFADHDQSRFAPRREAAASADLKAGFREAGIAIRPPNGLRSAPRRLSNPRPGRACRQRDSWRELPHPHRAAVGRPWSVAVNAYRRLPEKTGITTSASALRFKSIHQPSLFDSKSGPSLCLSRKPTFTPCMPRTGHHMLCEPAQHHPFLTARLLCLG